MCYCITSYFWWFHDPYMGNTTPSESFLHLYRCSSCCWFSSILTLYPHQPCKSWFSPTKFDFACKIFLGVIVVSLYGRYMPQLANLLLMDTIGVRWVFIQIQTEPSSTRTRAYLWANDNINKLTPCYVFFCSIIGINQ